jgi:hypothetical protein
MTCCFRANDFVSKYSCTFPGRFLPSLETGKEREMLSGQHGSVADVGLVESFVRAYIYFEVQDIRSTV